MFFLPSGINAMTKRSRCLVVGLRKEPVRQGATRGETTMMRQDRFTEGAQEVLAASQEMVRKERHSQWDVEHVLMALLTHERGITPQIFELLNVDTTRRRRAGGRALSAAPKLAYDVVQIYTTPRIVRMLEAANAEAERLKDEYVGVEHILIAIADEREGESAHILKEAGIDKERIYRALQEVRGGARVDSPTAESKYRALERYSVDLTEAARQGKLDPVIGREDEIKRVMQVLNRRTKNNPVIIGEAGVGKTAIAEGLAQKIVAGDVPENLKDKRVLALDMGAVAGGSAAAPPPPTSAGRAPRPRSRWSRGCGRATRRTTRSRSATRRSRRPSACPTVTSPTATCRAT